MPIKRPLYLVDEDIGCYSYGIQHPLKPIRVLMAHELLCELDIMDKLHVMKSPPPTDEANITIFHSNDYMEFLKTVTPKCQAERKDECTRYNVGDDSPVFPGLWEYCMSYTSCSLAGAERLASGDYLTAVNWSGGLHHGKAHGASGFCYINDCVLSILHLLRTFARVLYVDIDVHHGDGVEEAFYTSSRVLCVSFHGYGEIFPGSGEVTDIGHGKGEGYTINVPLKEGLDDEMFISIFKSTMEAVFTHFRPAAAVLQCGADSLSGDRLGNFNLTLKGHSFAVQWMKEQGIPTLYLGGGGYTLRNVAKCWAVETAVLADVDAASLEMPKQNFSFSGYYQPDNLLSVRKSNMVNLNQKSDVDSIMQRVSENCRNFVHPVNVYP